MDAGLEGVVAAETVLSQVNGQAGRLVVRGHDIEDLAGHMSFEAMAAFLWRDLAPGNFDETGVSGAMETARTEAFEKVPALLTAAKGLSLIDGLRTGLSLLKDGADSHIAVTAAVPVFIAALHRAAGGLAPVPPSPGQPHVADFFNMLNGEAASDLIVEALETYLLTVADHGMNASTFTARVVAATRAGTVASTVAALCALSGPLHGGAPGPVLDMLDEIGDTSRVAGWIEQHLGDGARLMGFGHRVYRTRDPRADVLKEVVVGLRVRPETLCRITEFSEHESNGRELDEGERVAVEVLPVLGQSAAAVEPGDGAFDHPTPGLDDEALHPIGSLDDLGLEIGQDAGQGAVKDRALIGAVGEQFPEKGKQTEQGRQQRETAVAILNVGGGDDAVQQQALRIDQNMPLLALDQLAGIEAVAVDASPPFSALFTL